MAAEPPRPERLPDVSAPVVVGVPPVNAFNGLFRCTDGEIRHYGNEGFIFSRDHGLTWQSRRFGESHGDGVAGGRRPLGQSPQTGTCLQMSAAENGMIVRRSTTGPDGEYTAARIDPRRQIMVRPPYFLESRNRVLFAGHGGRPARITVFRSDDDGLTWQQTTLPPGPAFKVVPPHAGPRWENWCVEPTIVELNDGRLWMLARTSRDRHRECVSEDGGETWSAWRPSRFYGTLTMPTLYRLSDGRILLLWCNTTPLPEADRTNDPIPESARNGRWEDVFTNRDAIHAAITEDEGDTWVGFRELRLNPLRNAADTGTRARHDFSVHQSQAVEVANGKLLVAHGQDAAVRALLLFDPAWLYERRRVSRFETGLRDWSTHQYLKGIVGHCSYNRVPGATLIPHPDRPDGGAQVLRIRHPLNPDLVFDREGATWNFPAARRGLFRTRLQLVPGGRGVRLCLLDRWVNPSDPVVAGYAMYVLDVPGDGALPGGAHLTPGRWHDLALTWEDASASPCRLVVDGAETDLALPLSRPTANGISYVHMQSLSDTGDAHGVLIESVEGGRQH